MTANRTSNTLSTLLQHSGSEHRLGDGIVGATEASVTYKTDSPHKKPKYSRLGNTANHSELEALLASIHRCEGAITTGSGMSAYTLLCTTLLAPGDHILCLSPCYGGTYYFLRNILEKWGVKTDFVPFRDWSNYLRPETKMVIFESISNPFCQPHDVNTIADFANSKGLISVCDNTFSSPAICTPADHKVDLILESATKYLNGHSDVVAGVICGKSALINKLRSQNAYLGTFLPTTACVQLMRGMRTLALRMSTHTSNAKMIADSFPSFPEVEKVYYGAQNSSDLKSIFPNGYGGMMAVLFKSSVNMGLLMKKLKLAADVPSLGGTETTATRPYFTTNWFMTEEEKKCVGITPHLLRISVGLEDAADILNDFRFALTQAKI
jgi:cystathionine beta-lyase/cystathionine gamma-synthase